jgi:hypothetical protein
VASSDAFANEVLTLVVEAGGSWYFGVLDAVPPADLSTFSLITEIPLVTLARNSATWDVANRAANPAAPITLDVSGVTTTTTPLAWCLFDDTGGTVPRLSGNLSDINITPGSPDVTVPVQTVNIPFPAAVADLL